MIAHELVPPPDPVRCCEQLADLPHRVFLDSAQQGSPLGRYSFLTAEPADMVQGKGADSADALDRIRGLLASRAAEPIAGLPPFQTGAAGYISYDWGRTLERLPATKYDDLDLADVVFGIYDWVIAWDHGQGRAWVIARDEKAKDRAMGYLGRPDRLRQGYGESAEALRAKAERAAPQR